MNQSKPKKYPDLSNVKILISEIVVRVRNALNVLGVEHKREISEDIEDIWMSLSDLYYKYEDDAWKSAYREVFYYISEKIEEEKWPTVYTNLYRREQKRKIV